MKSRYRLSAETWTTKLDGFAFSSNIRRKWKTPNSSLADPGGKIHSAAGDPAKTCGVAIWARAGAPAQAIPQRIIVAARRCLMGFLYARFVPGVYSGKAEKG